MADIVIIERTWGIIFLLSLVASIMINPVAAADAISTISQGNTVFIGEQGLDITAAMNGDTILGWFASGSTSSNPDYTISVPSQTNFFISPSDFGSRTGTWYHMSSLDKANGIAFSVADPSLEIRVEDSTVGVDVTNKWVSTDDDLRFRIDTNLVQINSRGVSVPIAIKVVSPNGATLSALTDKNGASTSIDPYQISTSPQYTGSIWSTKNRDIYPTGTYSIWAECNVNSMKDNYGQTGKTISSTISLLNQDQNPLIGNKNYVTNPTTAIATITTKVPTTFITATPTTPPPTTVVTTTPITAPLTETLPTITETSAAISTTIPTTTKSPGFGSIIVIFAGIVGAVLYARMRQE